MVISEVSIKSIINSSSVLKPNYHLNYGKKRIEKAKRKNIKFTSLANLTDQVYTGGIFKRFFVEKKEFGLPYISAQHMMKENPLDVAKIISKKYTPRQHDMTLRDKHILVSCAGTVGNIRLISEDLDGVIGSQDIIRVISDDSKAPHGFIYAYLSTKTAHSYIQSFIYGSVVPRLSPGILASLPIPVLPESKQQEIHNLIVKASKSRVEANKLLNSADELFHVLNGIKYEDYHLGISERSKYTSFKFRMNKLAKISIKAKNHSKRIIEIKELWETKKGEKLESYLSKKFKIGARGTFKRIDSSTTGIPMVSQGDLHRINPKNYKRVIISRRNSDDFANDNQVLFPSVGNGSSEGEILFRPTLSYKTFTDKLLSGDIGRLDCPSLEHAAYLLIALKSKGGFRMMRAFYYGTQLRRPIWELLKEIKIPVINEDCFKRVSNLAIESYNLRYQANIKENQAIELIEKEIESWQK